MVTEWFVSFLSAAMISSTPLLLSTLGELVTEKSGSQNLGVEGMMYMGAVIGFYIGSVTESVWLAVGASLFAGMVGALIFGILTITLRANQIVTGLTLTLFGTGFAGFVGTPIIGQRTPQVIIDALSKVRIPLLGRLPVVGEILFNQDVLVYTGYALVIFLAWFLRKSRIGLNGRLVGENPAAAESLGIPVMAYRYAFLLFGGALCGLAGGYLSLAYVPSWQDSMVAGRGWIAVALVIFSKWNPTRAIVGAIFFGGLDIIGFRLQKFNLPISPYLLDALPYVMTILVLVMDSVSKKSVNHTPKALGTAYFREER
ncbi:MAG: ABC transporter permease [Sphaerochaetaceae bacterium]